MVKKGTYPINALSTFFVCSGKYAPYALGISENYRHLLECESVFPARDMLQKPIGMLEVVFLEVVMRLSQLFLGAVW